MIYKRKNAISFEKHGVKMHIYNQKQDCEQAAIAYQETMVGHSEEFIHHKSAFIYYIIEGSGTYFIDGEAHEVKATDVVMVPPGKKIYFKGNLKQLCITAPAWEEAHEEHVRNIEFE